MIAPGQSRARGFTILEVLLAIMLLALLMAGAYAGIRTATRAAHAGQTQIDRTNKLRVTQEFLRRELSQTLPLPYEKDSSGKLTVFEGKAEQVTFVGPMPGYLGHGGPYVQQIALERDAGTRKLTFRHMLYNGYTKDGHDKVDSVDPVVLLENIDDATFEYRGMEDTGKLGDWDDEWKRGNVAPQMIRLKLRFARAYAQTWPELVIPVIVDPSAAGTMPTFGPGPNAGGF
jgi:general secretion pathway protein J